MIFAPHLLFRVSLHFKSADEMKSKMKTKYNIVKIKMNQPVKSLDMLRRKN